MESNTPEYAALSLQVQELNSQLAQAQSGTEQLEAAVTGITTLRALEQQRDANGLTHADPEALRANLNGLYATSDGQTVPLTTAVLLNGESTLADIAKAVYALGYEISDEDNGKVYEEFKRVVSRKESISAKELEAIVASTAMQVPSTYHVENYICNNGSAVKSMACVSLLKDDIVYDGVSTGAGPIDASFRAIEQAIGHHYELDDFQIQAVTEGREALGSALVKLRSGGKLYSGNGLSTDIVGASIRAFVNALNKIVYEEE